MPLGWQNPDLSVTLGCEAHQHRRFGVSGAHSAQPPHSPPTPQPPWQLAGDSIFPAPRDPVRQVISSWQDQGSVGGSGQPSNQVKLPPFNYQGPAASQHPTSTLAAQGAFMLPPGTNRGQCRREERRVPAEDGPRDGAYRQGSLQTGLKAERTGSYPLRSGPLPSPSPCLSLHSRCPPTSPTCPRPGPRQLLSEHRLLLSGLCFCTSSSREPSWTPRPMKSPCDTGRALGCCWVSRSPFDVPWWGWGRGESSLDPGEI